MRKKKIGTVELHFGVGKVLNVIYHTSLNQCISNTNI